MYVLELSNFIASKEYRIFFWAFLDFYSVVLRNYID